MAEAVGMPVPVGTSVELPEKLGEAVPLGDIEWSVEAEAQWEGAGLELLARVAMGGAVVGTGVKDALAAGVSVPASAVPDADLVEEAEALGEALYPGVPEAALDTLREAVEEEETEALVEARGLEEAARDCVGSAVVGAEVGVALAPGDCVAKPGLPDTLCVALEDALPDAVPKSVPEAALEALAGALPLGVGVARPLIDAV